jgi:hypothetical protein
MDCQNVQLQFEAQHGEVMFLFQKSNLNPRKHATTLLLPRADRGAFDPWQPVAKDPPGDAPRHRP